MDCRPSVLSPHGSIAVSRSGSDWIISYAPDQLPTAQLISLLQDAGSIREMTLQPENIDHLIAAMYREMDL